MIVGYNLLPKGVSTWIASMIDYGSEIELLFQYIQEAEIVDGIIVDCSYFEDGTSIVWFIDEEITYIMVNGQKIAYYEKDNLYLV